ncbi:MAG TPA: universal stress protein [Jatrophihabitantaceae bacterium]|jgi:nucleotide-binding universal stress UspA family protein
MTRIVVGVDASSGARGALEWAAGEARLRQAVLEVVYAYHGRRRGRGHEYDSPDHVSTVEPGLVGPHIQSVEPGSAAGEGDEGNARVGSEAGASDYLDSVLEGLDDQLTGVDVRRTVIDDRHPAEALLDASRDADLLVVGSRGRGGFSELMLGSVSHAVVMHAVCPVVVVPLRNG